MWRRRPPPCTSPASRSTTSRRGLMAVATGTASQFEMANGGNPMINTVVTNVPGPQLPLYFTGARLLTILGIGLIVDGMGLIHPVTSYCGELAIGFTACREMLPDPRGTAAASIRR